MKTTVTELKKDLIQMLEPHTEEAVVLAELIIANALCTDRATLFTLLDVPLDEATVIMCEGMVKKFISGIPVQYIFGECWFYSLPVKVGSGCFIPRSDTEVLAQAAIELLPPNGRFVELCCGSGCVSMAIAANRPDARGEAVDEYPAPLKYATENLAPYPSVKVRKLDVLEPDDYNSIETADMIIANPPYIPTQDIEMLDTCVRSEPHTALDGGEDGLAFYRVIIENAPQRLTKHGKLLFEVGYDQAAEVAAMLEYNGFSVTVLRDAGDIERVVIGSRLWS